MLSALPPERLEDSDVSAEPDEIMPVLVVEDVEAPGRTDESNRQHEATSQVLGIRKFGGLDPANPMPDTSIHFPVLGRKRFHRLCTMTSRTACTVG